MKFRPECTEGLDEMAFQGTPHTIFITNNETKKPLIDFLFETDYVKLYTDISTNHDHLNNSIDFLGVLQ
jgi:acyl-ACP thioesterase